MGSLFQRIKEIESEESAPCNQSELIEPLGDAGDLFNNEAVYDAQISPLMHQIIDICKEHGIPMIASFTYEKCPDRGFGRCTTLINNIPNRYDEVNHKACQLIYAGGHTSFAVAVHQGT